MPIVILVKLLHPQNASLPILFPLVISTVLRLPFLIYKQTIEGIVAFSTAPLVWSSIIGLIFCVLAFIALIFLFVRALIFGDPVSGWPSLACMITFFSGLQLFSVGIIGMYISKTYLEVKGRPIYIVKEKK